MGRDCESQSDAMIHSSMESADPVLAERSGCDELGGNKGSCSGRGLRMGCGTLSGQKYAAVFTTSVCCSRRKLQDGNFLCHCLKGFWLRLC